MTMTRLLTAAAGLVMAAAAALATPPQFTLHVLPGRASSLNDSNIAAMAKPYDATRSRGGLYNLDTGAFTALTIAMPEMSLTDIADSGWVTGVIKPTGGSRTIVAWNPALSRATIRVTNKPIITGPYVNSAGRVAWGESWSGGSGRVGYTWASGAGLRTNAALNSISHGIKAVAPQGWILGYTPTTSPQRATFMSAGGATTTIPLPAGAISSEGMDANAKQQYLLATTGLTGMRGHVWTKNTNAFRELSDPIGGRWLILPNRFNDIGDVVGLGTTISSPIPEPMLWVVDTGYTFREMLGGSYPAGWTTIHHPLAVNDHGYILGWGIHNGVEKYFVMKPVGLWHP